MTPRQLPTALFNLLEFSLEEIQHRLKTYRNGSAPGPIDQIPTPSLRDVPHALLYSYISSIVVYHHPFFLTCGK